MEHLLESASLYQKSLIASDEDGVRYWHHLRDLPAITAYCTNCKNKHTFNIVKINEERPESFDIAVGARAFVISDGTILRLIYLCKMCNAFEKEFFIRVSKEEVEVTDEDGDVDTQELTYAMKVGQYPAVSIEVEEALGKFFTDEDSLEIYKKGVMNESQGYGVGAFAYYRQVIEGQIDTILEEVLNFAEESKSEELQEKINEAKKKREAAEKIGIVKDFLPKALIPDGQNTLKIMYSALSDGLHNKTDEDCLKISQSLRACIVFLVKKIQERNEDEKDFAEAIKNIK